MLFFGGGDWLCVTISLYLIVLHFLPLFFIYIPGGGESCCLKTMVAADDCSPHGRDTLFSGVGTVASVRVFLRNIVGTTSQIALF